MAQAVSLSLPVSLARAPASPAHRRVESGPRFTYLVHGDEGAKPSASASSGQGRSRRIGDCRQAAAPGFHDRKCRSFFQGPRSGLTRRALACTGPELGSRHLLAPGYT